jgi:signal transduction histidine kinase
MSIKARQVAGVTSLVVLIVAALSALHMAAVARLSLQETASRGELLARSIFQRAAAVVPAVQDSAAAYTALQKDGGIRSLLESSIAYSKNVTYAAIVDTKGIAVAHSFPALERKPMADQQELRAIADAGPIEQLRAVYSDRTFEIRQPLLRGAQQFGSIRIGVSTLLVRSELQQALDRAMQTILVALLISSVVAMLLAQWLLRPIHVIQSGLTRLGRGELDVRLDLPPGDEFKDLGTSFDAVSAQLSAVRSKTLPTAATEFESVVENLEDAVALFSSDGELIFCNSATRALLPGFRADAHGKLDRMAPPEHPARQLVERTLASQAGQGPISVTIDERSVGARDGAGSSGSNSSNNPGTPDEGGEPHAERLLVTHAIDDADGRFVGAMLVARNLEYMSQVHSTLAYSRKLAALGRLMAGVAHEVKNPLNAMTIHLELLKQKLAAVLQPVGAGVERAAVANADAHQADALPIVAAAFDGGSGGFDGRAAREGHGLDRGAGDFPAGGPRFRLLHTDAIPPNVAKHVDIIAHEIQRLDQVVNGFLKFARPDELKLQPIGLDAVISDVATTVAPEAEQAGVTVRTECPRDAPEINADPAMLTQALLNLALNACQAMPHGGTLRLACHPAPRRRVEIVVEDTGVGIAPEHLQRIFDLYFTTKEKGSGIGLSMVYRIVQLHNGDVEVQSTPGAGTRFTLVFPQA